MSFFRLSIVFVAIGMAHSAMGQTSCKAFESEIDMSLKRIAKEMAPSLPLDNSAPRETMRQLIMNNHWQSISVNVNLMSQNKCPPLKMPPIPEEYSGAAVICSLSKIATTSKGESACDLQTWQKNKPRDRPETSETSK